LGARQLPDRIVVELFTTAPGPVIIEMSPDGTPSTWQPAHISEYKRYYVPASKVTIMVTTGGVDGAPAGSVWALHLTDEPDIALRPR
jgi:hypothetical protein